MCNYAHDNEHYANLVDETSILLEQIQTDIDGAVDQAVQARLEDTEFTNAPVNFAHDIERMLKERLIEALRG